MKTIALAALAVASVAVSAPAAFANPHPEWHKGRAIDHGHWDHAERVDWKARHLHRPPRGYEWRDVDGNYVMAAVATGVIANIIAH